MKRVVVDALAILDAGKAVRIAEQELSCVPVNPPVAPSAEPPSDERAFVQWRERHLTYAFARKSWENEREAAEAKLEDACQKYIEAIARGVAHAWESKGL